MFAPLQGVKNSPFRAIVLTSQTALVTTSEFMIGRSLDDAADRKDEARKVFWALLAAVFIHLLIGYSLATFSGVFSSAVPVEEKPMELTIVDLSPPTPVVAKNPMFMETDESKQSAEQPKEKTFESNANSIAASQLPATGEAPLPSQQGKDRPSVDLETHAYALANEGARPQPSAPPQQTPQPSQATQSTPISDAEQFALLTAKPTPAPTVQPSVAPTPQQPRSTYQPQKQQTRLSGSITNRGAPTINAVGTPLGRYRKILYDAVGSRWYYYMSRKGELADIGTARLVFSIDRSGHVKNLRVIQNDSNEAFANVCLQSVLEIQLPPIPEDVANTLPSEGLDEEMSFTLYAN
jgi:outer membrane biosynthesis protein TonB